VTLYLRNLFRDRVHANKPKCILRMSRLIVSNLSATATSFVYGPRPCQVCMGHGPVFCWPWPCHACWPRPCHSCMGHGHVQFVWATALSSMLAMAMPCMLATAMSLVCGLRPCQLCMGHCPVFYVGHGHVNNICPI
jgi:hypothetical protein